MGLLDSVLGAVMGQAQPQQGGMLGAVAALLAEGGEGGGLRGLVDKFNDAGLGDVVGSWISTGPNLPVSPEQLKEVLGSDLLGSLAGKLGMDPAQASDQLAQVLPGLVDQLTPAGVAPEHGLGDAGSLLGALAGMLQKS